MSSRLTPPALSPTTTALRNGRRERGWVSGIGPPTLDFGPDPGPNLDGPIMPDLIDGEYESVVISSVWTHERSLSWNPGGSSRREEPEGGRFYRRG